MKIRPMVAGDVNRVMKAAFEGVALSSSELGFWSKEMLCAWCESGQDLLLVAEDGARIVGLLFCACHPPTRKVTLENVWFDNLRAGQPTVDELLKTALAILKEREYRFITALATTAIVNGAVGYFMRHGFKAGKSLIWFDRTI